MPPDTQHLQNNSNSRSEKGGDDKNEINEPIQVSIGTKYLDSPAKTNFQTEEKKKSSANSSNLNVYLRHNSAMGATQKLEPVKLNAVKGMQQMRSSQEKSPQQARFGDPLTPSRTVDGTEN